jgi:hypothetical protein
LSPHIVAELRHTTASAEAHDVREAVRAAWMLGRRYWTELAELHDRPVPHGLLAELDGALKPSG